MSDSSKCEFVQEWKLQKYRIQKLKCDDFVMAFHNEYKVYIGEKTVGINASNIDSCKFYCQVTNESLLILNICDSSVKELNPTKVALDIITIDSITIFSNEHKLAKSLNKRQIETFVNDWNISKCRGYSVKPFDYAFDDFPSYQYKLSVYSKGNERNFYGYNYLILDSSNWNYEMSKSNDLNYFHSYWKR